MKRIAKLDRLLAALNERVFRPVDFDVELRCRAGRDGEDFATAAAAGDWRRLAPDYVWGAPETTTWFSARFAIPDTLAGCRLFLGVEAAFGMLMGRTDPQCLVAVDGRIAQAIDGNHTSLLLSDCAEAGAAFDVLIEAATYESRRQVGLGLRLLVHDARAEQLYFDLKVPLDVARLLKPDDPRGLAIVERVDAALKAVDLRPGSPERYERSLDAALVLADGIYELGAETIAPTIIAAGHTHIDVAWLWRTRETRRKMARSMATALALMDEYPDYRFMYNQCVLLDWLSADQPELFARLKAKVEGGQFEIEGALWLEPDVNIAGGEALVRHILMGVRYHEATFGVRPRLLWLPDTFGYSAALPQLMAKAGIEMFVTHKLSWNDTNRMPHDTFFWEGIDGTRRPVSFVTTQPYEYDGVETTYCADLRASYVLGTWKRNADKADQSELFMIYGHGDGGGGPTRAMVETLRRFERGIPGSPRVRQDSLGAYFHRLAGRMAEDPGRFAVWSGELYLEYHRGTLTSVAKVKRNNRKAEIALRELETLAALVQRAGGDYPAGEIAAHWKILLLNQFHDILPGSSIGAVYDDSDREFARLFAGIAALEKRLAATIGGGRMVLNASGRRRGGLLALPEGEGAETIVRADGTRQDIVALAPVAGLAVVPLEPQGVADTGLAVAPNRLENDVLRVELDARGRIFSLYDKRAGRELLPPGEVGNRLVAYRDMPVAWDAWDIDASFEDVFWDIDDLVAADVVETGPLRVAIRLEWRYEQSRIVEVLSLAAGADRLEIDGFADWHEHRTLVKVHFPVAFVGADNRAEIQFGHLRRPTHRNTSWEAARFETSMHRWVDLSEADFGLAVLNDCKYGYDARGDRLRLTLLKSPVYPWPEADQGEHWFRYALMPHGGFNRDGGLIVDAAEDFNMPLRLLAGTDGEAAGGLPPLFAVAGDGVVVEAVKKAEDGEALIARLYEARGRRTVARLDVAGAAVAEVDLLEGHAAPLEVEEGAVTLAFSPFEIKTIRIGG